MYGLESTLINDDLTTSDWVFLCLLRECPNKNALLREPHLVASLAQAAPPKQRLEAAFGSEFHQRSVAPRHYETHRTVLRVADRMSTTPAVRGMLSALHKHLLLLRDLGLLTKEAALTE